ncbi:MAG: hypothetical protein ACKOXB_02500 [Flavobacteriales bacterium]
MKFFLSFALLLVVCSAAAQTVPHLKKYDISDSKFRIYLPSAPDPVSMEYSPDSAKVYTIEALDSSQNKYFHFGAIVVTGLSLDNEIKEEMLISYMDYLKTSIGIESSIGYGKGHTLSTHASAVGVIDYWKDKDGDEWKVKGWIDNNSIVVMFIYGPGEYPIASIPEIFFAGIRFPED